MEWVNLALVILTLGLVITTIIYTLHTKRLANDTKRMADVIAKDYETRVRPIVDFEIGSRFRPLHGKEGLYIDIKVFNLGKMPVNVSKFILTWWYKDQPDRKYSLESEVTNKVLYTERTYSENPFFPRHEFEKEEVKGDKRFEGYNFFKSIAGELCLYFLDCYGNPQRKCKMIESIVS